MCRSRGPLWGSSALLPPKPSVSARPNLSEPSPDEIYCAGRSASSLDPAAFISHSFTKSPGSAQCLLIPTENTRTATKTHAWPGVQLHLNAQEMRSCWMLLCICLGLIPQASRLLLFWASAQLTRGRRSLTVVMFDSPTSQLLNRFFWLIRSNDSIGGCSHFSRYESFRIRLRVKLKLNK